MIMVYDSRVISYIVSEIQSMSSILCPIKVYIFTDGAYPYTEDFKEVIEKVTLIPMPSAMQKALRYILPEQNDVALERIDLSETEIEKELKEAERIEEGKLL